MPNDRFFLLGYMYNMHNIGLKAATERWFHVPCLLYTSDTPLKAGVSHMKSLSVRNLTRVAMFTALMCVLAYVFLQLPISPVAISAQTFGVMLAGLVLEPNLAALSQALYVLLGALGLPVFAGGASGIGILIGPKGGYLWGFIVGAYVTAAIIQKSEKNGKPIPLLMLAFASLKMCIRDSL